MQLHALGAQTLDKASFHVQKVEAARTKLQKCTGRVLDTAVSLEILGGSQESKPVHCTIFWHFLFFFVHFFVFLRFHSTSQQLCRKVIGGSSEEREKAMKNLTDKAASNAKGFASVT